jgi:nitronate monooxygenase
MAGLATQSVALADIEATKRGNDGSSDPISQNAYPSAGTEKLLGLLKIEIPIIQAPTGGVVTSDMTAAVANSGGLGGIPLSWSSPEQSAKQIAAVRAKTQKSFFANFVLNFEPVALRTTLDEGVNIIQFSWGMPDVKMIDAIRHAGAVMGIQVTSKESAEQALGLGADYLVCQGTEAGGHVHASRPLAQALESVLSVAGEVPVLASGGIATGQKMRAYMQMGAAGVVMGSRFVATKESGAHDDYKNALVEAKSADTVFTTCMNKGWAGATHRILRNSTFEMWESVGCPVAGKRPGEMDSIVTYGTDNHVERYSINSPASYYSGNIEAMAAYAGEGVDDITDVPEISEVMSRVWNEFLSAG